MTHDRSSSGPGASSLPLIAILCAGSAVFLVGILHPVLNGLPFADDWANRIDDPMAALRGGVFFELRPYEYYRPLQAWLIALSEVVSGGTLLLHLVQIASQVALLGVVLLVLRALGEGPRALILGAAYLATSQLNGPALGGNDTASLVVGTTFGIASVALAWSRGRALRLAGSLACLSVALLAKESSLGYVPIVAVVLWFRTTTRSGARIAIAAVPFLLAAAYLGWRAHLGAAGPTDDAAFSIGVHMVPNTVRLLFAATLPLATTQLFTAIHFRDWSLLAVGLAGSGVVACLAAWGIASRFGIRLLVLVAVAALCSIAPVLPLRHVSELYAYPLVPLVAVGFALGAARLLQARSRGIRAAAYAIVVIVPLMNAGALRYDATAMARNGRQSAALMASLRQAVSGLPEGDRVALVEPAKEVPDYSVYRMTGFRLTPPEEMTRDIGREDLVVDVVEEGAPLSGYDAVLTLSDDGRLIRLDSSP